MSVASVSLDGGVGGAGGVAVGVVGVVGVEGGVPPAGACAIAKSGKKVTIDKQRQVCLIFIKPQEHNVKSNSLK